ncbi:MAG: non-heme iron oxygenase ferredoxin subunit [Candidatus Curtissbacteria bacterium]|nr:non-heme iron oxygenase ferredoxin subunit [Candidatus Curtissbacteria bacterium]
MSKVKVATISEVEKGKVKQVKIGDDLVALYHTASDEWYATSDICTHEECNLSYEGGKLSDYETECDCHGSRFDIRTGKVLLPPAFEDLKTYKVFVENDDVYVET